MSAAKQFILENSLGQKVRTLSVQAESFNLVYLKQSRRVEAFICLQDLEDKGVEYTFLGKIDPDQFPDDGIIFHGMGRLRVFSNVGVTSPVYELPPQDDREAFTGFIKKSTVGHIVAVSLLITLTWIWGSYFAKKEEPPLVTITLPQEAPQTKTAESHPHVKVSATKLKQTTKVYKKIVQKNLMKTHSPHTTAAKDVRRMGALAALGGVPNGHHGAEGLDTQSVKNIRSAGQGNGGGGIGSVGRGGAAGYLPGNGLIAGSAGSGARAQGAGGYGTKGSGGGRAGYGKISLVGGTSAVSLPMDDEATVEGGLDRDQIIAVINRNKGQIIYCYEKGLQVQPSIGGRVAVSFVIGAAGKITSAKVAESSLGSNLVENCMLAHMKTWQFPHPVGHVNVDVLYPFELMRVSQR
ncbi:MAG: TonB family protein [Pseudobdellovibrionaceae bacterium]